LSKAAYVEARSLGTARDKRELCGIRPADAARSIQLDKAG
jgi:hypothetical protein